MKLNPFSRSKKEEEKMSSEREHIKNRLAKVRKGANDSCEGHDVTDLVSGLAEGDG